MHLTELLLIICATSHLLGAVFGRKCYNCKAFNVLEKDGPCREFVESTTSRTDCTDWCKLMIEDKSELGQGVWYRRSCVKKCANETDSNGEISFTTSCCKGNLCNGDEIGKNRPTPETPTTPVPATTTTPAPATGTTSEQTITDGSTGTEHTASTVPSTGSPTKSPWKATTLVPLSNGQNCYQCSSFFLGDTCDAENLDSASVDQVFCGADIGSCGKIVTRLGFKWLGFDLSKSRGCTTLCTGKIEQIERSIFTDIYCCAGDLCNGATPGVSRTTFFHVIITVAAAFWIQY